MEIGPGIRRSVLLLAGLVAIAPSMMGAQTPSDPARLDRKVATRVAPAYPDLARKMHIHGVVKVEAIVKPNGQVRSTRVLGGNPVLVDAALDAVGKWKFEPSQSETTEVVQLTFDGN